MYEKAIPNVEVAAKPNVHAFEPWLYRAIALWRLDDREQALKALQEVRERSSRHPYLKRLEGRNRKEPPVRGFSVLGPLLEPISCRSKPDTSTPRRNHLHSQARSDRSGL